MKTLLKVDGKDLKRFEKLLLQYVGSIKSSIKAHGKWASGRTWKSIKYSATFDDVKMTLDLRVFSDKPIPVNALETGREDGKIPLNMVEIIKQWLIDKGISVKDMRSPKAQGKHPLTYDQLLTKVATAISYKIKHYGTKQYMLGTINTVFTSEWERRCKTFQKYADLMGDAKLKEALENQISEIFQDDLHKRRKN